MARSRRQGRDDDDERGVRGGRGGRRGGDGGFSAMLLVGMVLFLAVTGGAVWAWYASREKDKEQTEALAAAYEDWLKDCTESFRSKAGTIAITLKPIYEDVPTEKQTPELIAALSQKYGPALNGTGATYSWCKKSWSVKGQSYGANISPNNASQFLMTPANCSPLGTGINLQNINNEPSMSGAVSFFYDRDDNIPKAVVSLNLAPSPATAKEGEGPPKSVTPTSFTLWFFMPEPTGLAKQALDQKMHPKAGR